MTTRFGFFLSWLGIFSEVWSFNRYDSSWQIFRLLWYGVLENFGSQQWKTYIAWRGIVEYRRDVETWGRAGFGTDD